MSHPYDDFTLLVDGKEAFPVILDHIARAQRSTDPRQLGYDRLLAWGEGFLA